MSPSNRLKIAYLCETSPKVTWAHSGGNTRIYNTVQEHIGDVTILSNKWGKVDFVRRLIEKLPFNVRLRLRFRMHTLLAPFIAKQVEKELAEGDYDVLFCPYSFFCLLKLNPPKPVVTVFSSDATYWAYKYSKVGQAFGSYFSLSRKFDKFLFNAEKSVYQHANLCLWPSRWIKKAADELYELRSEQSHLVHWGANIRMPDRDNLMLDTTLSEPLKLLLVGRDWFPKGGPLVVDTLKALKKRGIQAHLTVVGCVPPEDHQLDNMTIHPQLNKQVPEELKTFESLYKTSHLFVMPSYEAYGFAFCEAGAYGLPSLCLDVGGVPIKNGVNGNALPDGSTPEDFADQIETYINDPVSYLKLRQSTRDFYEEHLHWGAWGKHASNLINEKVTELASKEKTKQA